MEKFIKRLCDLYVKQDLSLEESLRIMSYAPVKKIRDTSEYILSCLKEGLSISNALKTCTFIHFDSVVISFFLIAESLGEMKRIVSYLNDKTIRSIENRTKLIGSIVYPSFVVLLAFVSSIALCFVFKEQFLLSIYKAFFVLLCIYAFLILLIRKLLEANKLYEAFLGADFLIKCGASISKAMACGALIAGIDTREGRAFSEASEKVAYGMELKSALLLGNELTEIFFYAEETGDEKEVFNKAAIMLDEKNSRKRAVYLQLIEPVFTVITGSFLLVLIMNYFLPVINNFDWM